MKTGWICLIIFVLLEAFGLGWAFVEIGQHLEGGLMVGAATVLVIYTVGLALGCWSVFADHFMSDPWDEQLKLLCLLAIWPPYLVYALWRESSDSRDPPSRR